MVSLLLSISASVRLPDVTSEFRILRVCRLSRGRRHKPSEFHFDLSDRLAALIDK